MTVQIHSPEAFRAALYIRLSKEDEQNGPSESVTNQRALLQSFVSQHDLFVHDTYIDDGWSGTNFDRPAFRRMIADIEDHKVNMVITKDLSRLGRDYIMTGHYMERYFPEKGVRYISLLDGIDTGVESSANDITPFRAIMNDMYAKDISKKIKSVKREKQRRGQFIGGKPMYGYKMHPAEKNRIVIDEPAAMIVRHIFSMAVNGMSCAQIAAQLNVQGVPTPAVYAALPIAASSSGRWSGERISEMLQNETYIGNMVQGRQQKISYKSPKCRKQPPSRWVIVENTHPPLIDRETFQSVQRLLASRRHTRCRTYHYPLKGLIFCRECGHPLSVVNRKNAAGEDVLYFLCRTYQRSTKSGLCTSHTIRERAVMDALSACLREVCLPHCDLSQMQTLAESTLHPQVRSDCGDTPALRKQIQLLTARMDRMYMDHLEGLLADEDFSRLYPPLKSQRAHLESLLQDKREKSPVPTGDRVDALTNRFLSFTGRALLLRLVRRIELTEGKELLVYFSFPAPEPAELTLPAAGCIPH